MQVFYRNDQDAENAGDFSPSAAKPGKFVKYLRDSGRDAVLVSPEAATMDELCRAHSPDYVRGVLECEEPNGFGNLDPAVAASLPFTSGSLLSAARAVLSNGLRVACSPTSGFHHAGFDFGGGFCTFNGLMVTALALHAEGRARRVAIVDCDQHYGDGTEHIIDRVGCRDWCLSNGRVPRGSGDQYLRDLEGYLAGVRRFAPDIALFQAGADPHVHDPLGGRLTTAEMGRRDRMVFEALREAGIPVVWNLAGGYQRDAGGGIRPVLDLHLQTFDLAREVFY